MKKTIDEKTGAVLFEEEATLLDTKTPNRMTRQQLRALAREAATVNINADPKASALTRRERRNLARAIGNEVARRGRRG